MSYNLLLDTGFNKINKHWKLINCSYDNGYLVGNDTVFSIEQQIILPQKTLVYFSTDYICFDKSIQKIYVGVQCGDELETKCTKPKLNKRKRFSVVDNVTTEKIKVKIIVESTNQSSSLYVDSPLLIDIVANNKKLWSRTILDKILDYRYGFDYINEYHQSELTLNNPDIKNSFENICNGIIGTVVSVTDKNIAQFNFNGIKNHTYLVKIDYYLANDYGKINLSYGNIGSQSLCDTQQYLVFKYNGVDKVTLTIENQEVFPYIINLRHLLIIDITDKNIEENDIKHLPYI